MYFQVYKRINFDILEIYFFEIFFFKEIRVEEIGTWRWYAKDLAILRKKIYMGYDNIYNWQNIYIKKTL